MAKLLFLELNEVNFTMVEHYADRGALPNFAKFIEKYGYCETTSESQYEHLEPWIQWVTAHTGATFAEHGVFRLGDIVNAPMPQIWEQLEQHGLRVGAISPMNAVNLTTNAAFFIPDPWTKTKVSGSWVTEKAHDAICQIVGDNAKQNVSFKSLAWLAVFAAVNSRPKNYAKYIKNAARARHEKWQKAIFLDRLLADTFVSQTKRAKPDFATLFLNAAAHIQHHYMFSSPAYDGDKKNPSWHVSQDADPLFDVYKLYDEIIGTVVEQFPRSRIMIATGLHQDPHPDLTFYWRLTDHAAFLSRLGVEFTRVDPLMSRDFVVSCRDAVAAGNAGRILNSAKDLNGTALFEVDNRGTSLFVMLTYPEDIPADFVYECNGETHSGLREDVAFVAIKNGQHNGIGYFGDTGNSVQSNPESFPLCTMPDVIKRAML